MSDVLSSARTPNDLLENEDDGELKSLQENGTTEWSKRRKRTSYGTKKINENVSENDNIVSTQESQSFTQVSHQEKGTSWDATLSQQDSFDEYDGHKDGELVDSETQSLDCNNSISVSSLVSKETREGKISDHSQAEDTLVNIDEKEKGRNIQTQNDEDLEQSSQELNSIHSTEDDAGKSEFEKYSNSHVCDDELPDSELLDDSIATDPAIKLSFNETSKSAVDKDLENDNIQNDSDEGDHSEKADDSTSVIYSQEDEIKVMDSEMIHDKPTLEKGTSQPIDEPDQPSHQELLAKVDAIYVEAEKDTLTVKHIVKALEKVFHLRLKKPARKAIKARVLDLLLEKVQPGSQVSDDLETKKVIEKKVEKKVPRKVPRKTSPRKVTKKKKKRISAAERIHADYQKRRLAEIERVRKEELLQEQERKLNEEDAERARLIAKKFETDSDELRIQRRQERLDLLTKLEETRKELLIQNDDEDEDEDEGMNTVLSSLVKKNSELPNQALTPFLTRDNCEAEDILLDDESEKMTDQDQSDSDEDEDSDESGDELEIVGLPNKPPSSDDFLRSPKQSEKSSPRSTMDFFSDNVKGSKEGSNQTNMTVNSRTFLKSFLRNKQISAGNQWLARELGYKNEEDHIRECVQIEQRKRQQILEKEEERRRLFQMQKERMLAQLNEEDAVENEISEPSLEILRSRVDADVVFPDKDDEEDEENEELAMARQIEEEKTLDEPIENQNEFAKANMNPTFVSNKEGNSELMGNLDQPKQKESSSFNTDEKSGDLIGNKAFDSSNIVLSDSTAEVESNEAFKIEPDNKGETPASKDSVEINPIDTSDNVEGKEVSLNLNENDEDEGEVEFDDAQLRNEIVPSDNAAPNNLKTKEKNSAWKAMLKKEADLLKKQRGIKNRMVDNEAEEEEEEDAVAGLEDFGFTMQKKKTEEDEDDENDIEGDDLENIVDELSDDEGDEVAGEEARKILAAKEEKEKHREIMRRMREGYDGRRGGIGAGGSGARGNHRFDQLIAADNRADAKRLGLLNDDEIDSDDDGNEGENNGEVEDETALLDKMLKDRYMNRIGLPEETFSEDEEEEVIADTVVNSEDEEEREQERLARRFAKRARMNRLLETYDDSEYAQSRLLDENEDIRKELKYIKDVSRKRQLSASSTASGSIRDVSQSSEESVTKKKQKLSVDDSEGNVASKRNSLSIALLANRKPGRKSNFFRANSLTRANTLSRAKSVSLGRPVLFQSGNSNQSDHMKRSASLPLHRSMNISTMSGSSSLNRPGISKSKGALRSSSSLWNKVSVNGFRK